ncbi:DNA primase [Fontisphaera persica]|uniref:DNA primase n=1 Tax=Fontisphaera persica TaxID=2974023 RepID=UPI0024BFA4EA|nr:DNA primase [Fontisphaera persica]WCJ58916.1 DNA primase [Fontisphaera persica]
MGGLISPQVIEQVRAASDIVEVISGYFPLKRAGANFVALCPFHKEKTPSFNVNPQRQIFHCFGCHKGGDVITFVREYENISFLEAVRRLAERANIPLAFENDPHYRQTRQVKDVLLEIHEQLTRRWQQALNQDSRGQAAREYLEKRGVSPEAVQLFRLGYAPEAWDDTVNWARHKGYDMAVMELAGLVVRAEGREHYYDRFRGRLMFPICDEQGRVIGFSGRTLNPEEKTAKYVNSPETPIFTKSRVFYGLDKSRRAIQEARQAVICEGQLDLIACYMAGVRHVVAPQGTAFTGEHARILKRYVEEVVLCFDADTAGQNAAERVADGLLPLGMAVRVAVLPAPHDPDSLVREQGPEALQRVVREAPDYFDYLLDRLCCQYSPGTDKGRLEITRRMATALQKARNEVLLETYAQKTALRFGLNPSVFIQQFRATPVAAMEGLMVEETPAPPEEQPPDVEMRLLQLVMCHDDAAPAWLAAMDLAWITSEPVRRLLAVRRLAGENQTWQGVAGLMTTLEEERLRNLLSAALLDERPMTRPEVEVRDALQQLRNQYLTQQIKLLQAQLSRTDLPPEQMLAAAAECSRLTQLKRQPLVL